VIGAHVRLIGATALAFLLLASQEAVSAQTSAPTKSAPKAVEGGGYAFVSGQGARRSDGSLPGSFADQVRQALENVKGALQSVRLTTDHLVYLQVYLEDVEHIRELDDVFASYFPKDPPARSVLGVAKSPDGVIQINAIAVCDIRGKEAVAVPDQKPNKAFSAGMLTHDQLFVSTMQGRDPITGAVPQDPALQVNLALDGLKSIVQAAGLTMAHMVFVNPYLTTEIPRRVMNTEYAKRFEFGNTPGRATIEVSSLPDGANIAYTGVAVRDLSHRQAIRPKNMPPSPTASPCVLAGDVMYCSAKDGFLPGPVEGVYGATAADQARQSMRNLLDNLEEAGMDFGQVVSTTIYLDNLADAESFSKIYKKYFTGTLPAQTFVQQLPPVSNRNADEEGSYPAFEQVSLIAVRKDKSAVKPLP
jgi:enamine deaminase RidA (YjgF/YER057c/UK114 family)